MTKLKLGIIGLSEGNGHPYSWSAVFNGYDKEKMKESPYPVIYEYLNKQNFPDDTISSARVTHVWTQDEVISREIAQASNIEFVVKNIGEMIGKVDAVLLARDDAENHFELAMPFIHAGIPIYIDKPLSYTVKEAKEIFDLEKYEGQIFTCSALRYAEELILSDAQKNQLGDIKKIIGNVPKDWKKYAIHLIDPLLANFKDNPILIKSSIRREGGATVVNFTWTNGIDVCLTATGKSTGVIELRFVGTKSEVVLTLKDTFKAFRNSLLMFVKAVEERKRVIPIENTFQVIELVELGVK